MAQQTINIGVQDQGNGDTLYAAFTKIQAMFTELYNDESTAEVNTVNGLTGTVVLTTTNIAEGTNLYYTSTRFDSAFGLKDTDDLTQGSTNLYNQTHTGDVTGSTALTISAGVVDFNELDARFNGVLTNSSASGALALDFSSYNTFKLTLTGDTTLSFSNVHQGETKNIIVTGAFTLTLPSGTLTNGVSYDGASSNLIQVIASESTVFHYSISQGTTVTTV